LDDDSDRGAPPALIVNRTHGASSAVVVRAVYVLISRAARNLDPVAENGERVGDGHAGEERVRDFWTRAIAREKRLGRIHGIVDVRVRDRRSRSASAVEGLVQRRSGNDHLVSDKPRIEFPARAHVTRAVREEPSLRSYEIADVAGGIQQ